MKKLIAWLECHRVLGAAVVVIGGGSYAVFHSAIDDVVLRILARLELISLTAEFKGMNSDMGDIVCDLCTFSKRNDLDIEARRKQAEAAREIAVRLQIRIGDVERALSSNRHVPVEAQEMSARAGTAAAAIVDMVMKLRNSGRNKLDSEAVAALQRTDRSLGSVVEDNKIFECD